MRTGDLVFGLLSLGLMVIAILIKRSATIKERETEELMKDAKAQWDRNSLLLIASLEATRKHYIWLGRPDIEKLNKDYDEQIRAIENDMWNKDMLNKDTRLRDLMDFINAAIPPKES